MGNLYYIGMANEGKNPAGKTLYKLAEGSTVTRIGADDFLQRGEVLLVRHVWNKLWLGTSLFKDDEGKQGAQQLNIVVQE